MPDIPLTWRDEQIANTTTAGTQRQPHVIQLANGNILVSWTTDDPGGLGAPAGTEIFAQIFDPLGNKVGAEIRLNDASIADDEQDAQLAALPNGGFVVVYHDVDIAGGGSNIRLEEYDARGFAVSSNSLVVSDFDFSEFTRYREPQVAVSSATSVLVVYVRATGNLTDFVGKIYDPTTDTYSGQISLLSGLGGDYHSDPQVAVLTNGNYVVASKFDEDNAPTSEIVYRIVSSTGANVLSATFVTGTSRNGFLDSEPSIVALAGGGFAIAWTKYNGNDTNIQMRFYNAAGVQVGAATPGDVPVPNNNFNNKPALVALADGGVAVIYDNLQTGGLDVTRLSAQGEVRGTFTFAAGSNAADVNAIVGIGLADGRFAAVWENNAGEISLEILDTRDAPNSPGVYTPDQWVVGTVGDDLALDLGPGGGVMGGGPGNDIYRVDTANDNVRELSGGGTDTVSTGLTNYTLPGNVEILNYTGGGAATLRGNPGNNILTGGGLADVIDLRDGGDDAANGGGGSDGFYFGSALTSADSVDGGTGTDQIGLQGNYAALTLGPNATIGVEFIVLLPGDDTRFGGATGTLLSYNLATVDANIAAGQVLTFQANTLRAGETFTLNGAAETNGFFLTFGGLGTENLTGGQQGDGFYFGTGRFNPGDTLNGGGGSDQVGFQGDFAGANALTFGATQLTSIEFVVLLSASDTRFGGGSVGQSFSYTITMNNGNVAAGQQMIIQANTLKAGEALIFNGLAETDGSFRVFGGAAADVIDGGAQADELTGGAGADLIRGGGGADTLRGGIGNDLFSYALVSDSTAAARDRILDFTTGDIINLIPMDANSVAAGGQDFELIAAGAVFTAAGQLRVTQTGTAALIEGDSNGDGIADFVIEVTVTDSHMLGLADFRGVTDNLPAEPLFDPKDNFEPWQWNVRHDPWMDLPAIW